MSRKRCWFNVELMSIDISTNYRSIIDIETILCACWVTIESLFISHSIHTLRFFSRLHLLQTLYSYFTPSILLGFSLVFTYFRLSIHISLHLYAQAFLSSSLTLDSLFISHSIYILRFFSSLHLLQTLYSYFTPSILLGFSHVYTYSRLSIHISLHLYSYVFLSLAHERNNEKQAFVMCSLLY